MTTIDPSRLKYLGAFKLPQDDGFPYGGEVAAFTPGGLYISGHVDRQLMAKVSIEAPLVDEIAHLNTAKVLKPFFDPAGGLRTAYMMLGGALAVDKSLLFTLFKFYNVDGEARSSHGISHPDGGSALGLWRLGGYLPHNSAGYLCRVPDAYRQKFGYPFLSGRTNHPSYGNRTYASEGPAAFGYNPWWTDGTPNVDGKIFPTKRFLWYGTPSTYTYNGVKHTWKGSNWTSGLIFPRLKDGSAAMIYFSRLGTYAEDWYGDPDEFPGTAKICGDGKGYHAPPYRIAAWFYDPDAVAAGAPNKRYAILDLTKYFYNKCCFLGGVGFDVANNIAYVIEQGADQKSEWDAWPVIHKFQIA